MQSKILHDRDGLVAVDKAPGIPSTGRSLEDSRCLQAWLAEHLGRRVWAVHQLDAETSGVNLFVRRKSLVAEVARRMRPPLGAKLYLAVCHGVPAFAQRRVDAPIGPLDGSGHRLGVTAAGRPAHSRVRVLDRAGGFALLEVELATGRTHQVRIHLAHIGHPLVGERRYRQPPCDLHPRHALHAWRVRLGHGADGLLLEAPLPGDLVRLACRLGLDPARAGMPAAAPGLASMRGEGARTPWPARSTRPGRAAR